MNPSKGQSDQKNFNKKPDTEQMQSQTCIILPKIQIYKFSQIKSNVENLLANVKHNQA